MKNLYWDQNGFWLYYGRLEKGKFQWPSDHKDSAPLKVTRRQLRWLLDGLSLEPRQAQPEVRAGTVI